jgi:hypothetical protein
MTAAAHSRTVQRALLGAACLAWAIGALPSSAEPSDATATPPPSTPTAPEWRPPVRDPSVKKPKDWIVLKSGEMIRGEIEHIRDEEVYFDSDELDDLEIDWDDMTGFVSPRINTYRFGDDTIVTGTAAMHGGVIRVDTGTEVREFPAKDLYSMIEGELREINYWSLDASLGLTLRSGNSDQTDFTSSAKLQRETPLTRGRVSYETSYSATEGNDITNNRRLSGLFAYYVTTKFYVAAPIGEVYTDKVRNIDLRGTIAAGVGYDVVDRPKVEWSVLGAAGYQRSEFSDVVVGDPTTAEDAALLFQTTLEADPYKDVDWDTEYQLAAVVTDWDKTSHHFSSKFSFEVWGPFDLDVTFTWDRIVEPEEEADGERPQSDDFQLTLGVSLELP